MSSASSLRQLGRLSPPTRRISRHLLSPPLCMVTLPAWLHRRSCFPTPHRLFSVAASSAFHAEEESGAAQAASPFLSATAAASSTSSSSSVLPLSVQFSLLTFSELVTFTTRFLHDFYDRPPPNSRAVARTLMSALQALDLQQQPVQQHLQRRLLDGVSELLQDGAAVETELEDGGVLVRGLVEELQEEEDDELRRHADVDLLHDRIVAHSVPHPSTGLLRSELAVEELKGSEDGVELPPEQRFHAGYSTDQMLVDSLPTLQKEEVVQIGRRDVLRLLSTE